VTKDDWHDQGFAANWDEAGNLFTNPDRLNQLSLLADLLAAGKVTRLLDLGIGSAQVEAAIQRRQPAFFAACEFTGIDASDAMLGLARERCEAEGLANVSLLRGDFAGLDEIDLSSKPDGAICVQALHEVPHEVKRAVFAWIHERLPAGAPFYILDRFIYPGEAWLGEWRATWDWMRSRVDEEVLEFDAYHRRYSAKQDHIASVEDYRGWLGETGFETVCPYLCFNRALIVARA
jgi:SAM-dependent methyltransferase